MFVKCSVMLFASVYILASRRNGTLYTGVTSNLEARIWQHRQEVYPGFARKYGCKTLVWFEMHDDINEAIAREKRIKEWRRAWKLDLIERENPDWCDLFEDLLEIPASCILAEARALNLQSLGPGVRRDDTVGMKVAPERLVIPANAGTQSSDSNHYGWEGKLK
jgi:putative endonuclease